MAIEDLVMDGVALQQMAANTGDKVATFAMIGVWLLLIAGIVIFAFWWSSFKYKVRIRNVAKNRRIVSDDKAKVRTRDGVEYWYFRKRRVYVAIPPPEALEVDTKGRFVAECYHNAEAGKHFGYYWIKDDTKDITNPDSDTFKPLSTEKQSAMINRLRRAEERRGKSLFEHLVPIVMTIGMIAAIALPLIFYGDLAKANQDQFERIAAVEMAIANKLDDVVNKATCYNPVDYTNKDVSLTDQIKPPEVKS